MYRLFYDTVKGGDYRAREANVYRLAQVSSNIIDQCVAQGVPFAREYGGLLDNRSFGGAQVSRTFYARGQTGQQLLLGAYSALARQMGTGQVKFFPRREMLDLVLVDGQARGIIARNLVTGQLEEYAANAVLLCTGGYGNTLYLSTMAKASNKVSGVDITEPFVEAANKLTALLKMENQVKIELGDGQRLPYADASFDGGYTQHVTMSVADRPRFFAEAYRVLKPGAFFALTDHGLGPKGDPYYPLPWSEDGSGAYLVTPSDTRAFLEAAGFEDIFIEDTGPKYVAAYKTVIEKAEKGILPPLGIHILMGETAMQKTRNSMRNIEEGRTHPLQAFCRKPR